MQRLFWAAAFVAAAPAYAAHPLITEDTGTQGKGRWQLEANAESTRSDEGGGQVRGFQPAATLSYGVAENIDLQLTQPWLREKAAGVVVKGPLDTSVDVKWRFFEKGALGLALKPGVTLATWLKRTMRALPSALVPAIRPMRSMSCALWRYSGASSTLTS